MSGYIAFHRGVFDHPFFKREPLCEKAAWAWLLKEAAYKDREARVGRKVFALQRGQLVHALRFIAGAWMWDLSRVRRFLARLTKENMIDTLATREATLITICNYDKWQPARHADETQKDTSATHPRHRLKEVNNNTDDEDRAADLQSQQAWEIIGQIEPFLGIDAAFSPPEWLGTHSRVLMGLQNGWRPEIILESVKAQAARKTDPPKRFKYYEQGIADAHAQASAPIPEGKIISIQAGRHAKPVQNLSDVARELHAEFQRVRTQTGTRDSPDDADVRLIPQGRGE